MTPRVLLVVRQAIGRVEREPRAVGFEDLHGGLRDRIDLPGLRDVRCVARVFLHDHVPVAVHRDVVEGACRQAVRAEQRSRIDHEFDLSTRWVGDRVEREPVEPGALRLAAERRASRHPVEGIRVLRIPVAVLGSGEFRDARRRGLRLERCARTRRIRGEVLQREAAAHGAIVLERHGPVRVVRTAVRDLDSVQLAVLQPRAFDGIAVRLLVADVHVDLARRRVVEAHDDGPVPRIRMGDGVFPRELAEVRQLVARALPVAGDDVAEGATFVAALLAVHEDESVEALARRAVVEAAARPAGRPSRSD